MFIYNRFIFFFFFFFYKNNFNNLKNVNNDKIIIFDIYHVIIKYVIFYLLKKNNIKNLKKIIFKNLKKNSIKTFNYEIQKEIKIKFLNFKLNKKINIFQNKIWIFCNHNFLIKNINDCLLLFCGNININNIILIYNNLSNAYVNNIVLNNIKKKFNSINWDVIGPININNYNLIKKSFKKSIKSFFPTIIIFQIINFFLNNKFKNNITFNKKNIIYKNFSLKYLYVKKIFYDNKIKYFLYFIKNYNFLFLELIRILNNIFLKFNLIKLYLKYENKSLNRLVKNELDFLIYEFCNLKNITLRTINFNLLNLIKNKKKNIMLINNKKIYYSFLFFSNYIFNIIKNSTILKKNNIFLLTYNIYINKTNKYIKQIKIINFFINFYVFKPFNLIELIISWYVIIKLKKNTSVLILSKNFKNNFIFFYNIKNIYKGCYELINYNLKIELSIISSGYNLEIVFNCYFFLKKYFNIKIISLYCLLLFNKQKKNYKKNIFTKKVIFFESLYNMFINKYNIKYFFIYNIKNYNKLLNKKNLIKLCLYIIKL